MWRFVLVSLVVVALGSGVAAAERGAGDAAKSRPKGAPATCRHQSSAGFSRHARNLVVGPLVLSGGRQFISAADVATFGGQKYAAIVLSGHRVTIELERGIRRTSLMYADDHWSKPDGERKVSDGHRVVDFRACAAGQGLSSYDGRKATFWSGFVATTVPRCLKLRIWVDDERTPRRARIALGKRCA